MSLPPPLSLTLLLLFQLTNHLFSALSLVVIRELQPCVTCPLWTNSCMKTRQLIHRSPLTKDRVNPRQSACLLLLLFPSQNPHVVLLLPPACFFQRTGPSVHNNAGNLTLFNASGQLALRPLQWQDPGAVSQQFKQQSSSLPSLPFCAVSQTLITPDKTETLAAVSVQHNVLDSLLCFCSPTVLTLLFFLN